MTDYRAIEKFGHLLHRQHSGRGRARWCVGGCRLSHSDNNRPPCHVDSGTAIGEFVSLLPLEPRLFRYWQGPGGQKRDEYPKAVLWSLSQHDPAHRTASTASVTTASSPALVARARELLAAPASAAVEDAAPLPDPRPPCPCCGGRMVIIEIFQRAARARAPLSSHPSPGTSAS
jgi:hypothetical protein